MSDKLEQYKQVSNPLPQSYSLWPLYGAGLESLGKDGKPIDVPLNTYGPDELLIRHDACGLCFSDIKVISQGQSHPRITQNMQIDPVVLGHEVIFTVVGVGENLKGQYHVGQRLTLQPETFNKGKSQAYGYYYQGGLSQYSVIGADIYATDDGNNLIPVREEKEKGYAEIALAEPWACVVAAYTLKYRTSIKSGGTLWIVGAGGQKDYTISAGFDSQSHPARLLLSNVPAAFAAWLKARAAELNIEVTDVADISAPPVEFVDDIVVLGASPEVIETVSPHLELHGVLAVLADEAMPRKVNVDVGRVHYHRWVYVGSKGADVAGAYQDVPVRASLKPGGRALFVGAGGPMGRMHVQRAIEFNNPPATIVCSDVSDMRLGELADSFAAQAKAKGIEFICLNPMNKEAYQAAMAPFRQNGFDDVVVLAPVPAVISDSATFLGQNGVMNIFAGVARGTTAALDLSDAYLKNARVIGHSASVMDDMQLVLEKTYANELAPIRSVAAVGSLSAAKDGLKAVKDATLAGKVVIYPNIKELPLTPLAELKNVLPSVAALLNDRGEWTKEAEDEFLRLMLP
jgi:threonine dehydrogenase-like Zn-dependent dehydrogenase